MAEEKKNNAPSAQGDGAGIEILDNETLKIISGQVIDENLPAYKELAK